LAGFPKAETHAHAWFKMSTGIVCPPLLWSESPGPRNSRGIGTLPKLTLPMLSGGRLGDKQESGLLPIHDA
jgi:hypothetical protein